MTETIYKAANPDAISMAEVLERYAFKPAQDAAAELRRLHAALAAAEARNATLTDDAARYRWLRDMTAAPSWYAAHVHMGISCEVFDMRLDAEMKEKTP